MTRNSDAQCPGTKRQIAQECVRLGWIAAHFRLSDQLDGPFRSQRARPQRLSTAKLQAYFVSQSNGDLLPQLSMRSWLHPRALKTCLQLTARHLELHFPLVHSKHSQHCRHPERFRFEGSRERFISPHAYPPGVSERACMQQAGRMPKPSGEGGILINLSLNGSNGTASLPHHLLQALNGLR